MSPKQQLLSADDIRAKGSVLYKQADDVGAGIAPSYTDEIIDEFGKVAPQSKGGKALAGENEVSGILKRAQDLRGQQLGLTDIHEMDKFLGGEATRLAKAGNDEAASAVLKMQGILRDKTLAATGKQTVGGGQGFKILKEAREVYKQSFKMDDIEQIIKRAELTDNPATSIKSGMRNLLMNKNKIRAYSQEERKLIAKAAKTGVISEIARTVGSRLPAIVSLGAGGGVGNVLGLQAGGFAGRSLAEASQMKKANAVAGEISRKISGAAPQMSTQMPSAAKFAPLAGQAANLMNSGPGITVSEPTAPISDYQAMPEPEALEPIPEIGDQSALPADLQQDEGMRQMSYMDTEGNKTVGIGFNMDSDIAENVWKKAGIDVPFGDVYKGKAGITDGQAQSLAMASYQIAREDASNFVNKFDKLSEGRQQALMNLSYQLGATRLSKFTEFKKAMNDGNYRLAARELVMSEWFGQAQDSRKRRVIQQILQG